MFCERLFLSLAIALATPAVAADDASPEQALGAYATGLREGSLQTLQKLFLPDGQFCSVSAAESKPQIACRTFSDVLASWVAQPDSDASGRVLHRTDATPSMSAITYELKFNGTRYIDQLLLYRIEGRWQVVAKTTTVQ